MQPSTEPNGVDSPQEEQLAHQMEQPNGHPLDEENQQEEQQQEGQYMTISNALAGQRASKKRAEDDVKLLANRLALLKLEEKKAWKKIEETKKKATEIMHVRIRNQENKQFKDDLKRQKE